MRKPTIRTNATVAAAKPVAAKPARKLNLAPLGTAAAAQAKRSNVVSPAAKPAKPATSTAVAALTVAKPSTAGIARTAATIARDATAFGGITSDRDHTYIAFYAGIAKRDNGTVSLSAIVGVNRRNPLYSGSNKAHDAGVIVRLHKAGIISPSADGHSFTFTDAGKKLAGYSAAKPISPSVTA